MIDVDSITVTLTQIGSSQDLIVESIDWGKVVKVKSGNGTSIDCYYVIQAARIDGEPLIVEYEGETPGNIQEMINNSQSLDMIMMLVEIRARRRVSNDNESIC